MNQGINDLEPFVMTLAEMQRKDLAVEVLDTFAKFTNQVNQLENLAKCYFKMKEYHKAIKYANDILAHLTEPEEIYITRSNLINVYNHANMPENALQLIRENEKIVPYDINMRLEKSYAYFLSNRRDYAEMILREELNHPNLEDDIKMRIEFNLGTYELYRDEFLSGLHKFVIIGRNLNSWKNVVIPEGTFWDGQSTNGKTLYIFAEAGIGDEFVNVRFMKHLKDRGINAIWVTGREDLCRIFNACKFPAITKIADFTKKEDIVYTYSMCLPLFLQLEYKDLWYGPYINSTKQFDDKVKWMNENERVKIGVRWGGNPEYENNLHRSIPLDNLYEIIEPYEDIANLYSLQKDHELQSLHNRDYEYNITDMNYYMETFEDTLAIINNLDIVITSCTSVAHAAAAMGKRTFVFVPISAYYVWCHSMEQSPWYGDNVTLLRQVTPRSWEEPMLELKEHLKNEIGILQSY